MSRGVRLSNVVDRQSVLVDRRRNDGLLSASAAGRAASFALPWNQYDVTS